MLICLVPKNVRFSIIPYSFHIILLTFQPQSLVLLIRTSQLMSHYSIPNMLILAVSRKEITLYFYVPTCLNCSPEPRALANHKSLQSTQSNNHFLGFEYHCSKKLKNVSEGLALFSLEQIHLHYFTYPLIFHKCLPSSCIYVSSYRLATSSNVLQHPQMDLFKIIV